MRTLLLMRHAKSSWSDPELTDHQRPLNGRGRRAAARMGRLLVDEDLVPDLILCSSSRRTRETVDLMQAEFANVCPVVSTDELYHASPQHITGEIAAADDEISRLLVVAHNPGIEELMAEWSGEERRVPTGAIAEYELPISTWAQLSGHATYACRRLWKPKELEPLEET